jgi:hypothetical protein
MYQLRFSHDGLNTRGFSGNCGIRICGRIAYSGKYCPTKAAVGNVVRRYGRWSLTTYPRHVSRGEAMVAGVSVVLLATTDSGTERRNDYG